MTAIDPFGDWSRRHFGQRVKELADDPEIDKTSMADMQALADLAATVARLEDRLNAVVDANDLFSGL